MFLVDVPVDLPSVVAAIFTTAGSVWNFISSNIFLMIPFGAAVIYSGVRIIQKLKH